MPICWRQADLFHNGNYLKSVCIINDSVQYAQAEQRCRTNRMELFIIDDPNTQFQLQTTVRQLLINNPRGFVWINGRVYDDCANWYSFNPEPRLLPNFIHWVQQRDFVGRNTGSCLRYTQQFTDDYFAMGVDCASSSWMACEFLIP